MKHQRLSPRRGAQLLFSIVSLALVIGFYSCSSSTVPEVPRTGSITQADLDAATLFLDSSITGDPFSAFGTDTLTTIHKMRDLFGSIPKSATIKEGTIFIRKAWYVTAPSSHKRDSVLNFVVMVKREPGYYTTGGDWEYIKIPFSKTTDYSLHPFGLLPTDTTTSTRPDSTKTNLRGRLQTQCATCHTPAPGADFLFSR